MSLKLLIDDGMQISLGTGIGKYSQYLYEALSRRDDIDVDLISWKPASSSRKSNRFEYLKYINSGEFYQLVSNYDATLFTNYAIPYRTLPCRVACCIPDMVSFLHPKTLPTAYRYYNRAMIRNSVKKSDIVLTISESVKKEIADCFPGYSSKIAYTWLGLYEGIHKDLCPDPYEDATLSLLTPQKFFLFVSTIEKRKNVGLVLDAFLKLKEHEVAKDYKMVFAGRLGYGGEEFVAKARESKYVNDILFTGYVSDSDLNRLYNEASAFVFPTVYEGFGFAQIECMSVGLPIILSDIPTNREISRDYGLYFNLKDEDSLIRGMSDVVNDRVDRKKLTEIATRYLPDFSWDAIAEQYVNLIKGTISMSMDETN